uniref:Uncharacterized protein n=1 Tax=Ditylenchus dipsaci TaxID=166011 RepID=A0A915DBF4_9BILA
MIKLSAHKLWWRGVMRAESASSAHHMCFHRIQELSSINRLHSGLNKHVKQKQVNPGNMKSCQMYGGMDMLKQIHSELKELRQQSNLAFTVTVVTFIIGAGTGIVSMAVGEYLERHLFSKIDDAKAKEEDKKAGAKQDNKKAGSKEDDKKSGAKQDDENSGSKKDQNNSGSKKDGNTEHKKDELQNTDETDTKPAKKEEPKPAKKENTGIKKNSSNKGSILVDASKKDDDKKNTE